MDALPVDTGQIVITASRVPEEQSQTPASVTITDADRIERLGEPLVPALLRLTPSVAVTQQGPAGLLTEVRIRGAETNHTLLFVDGIRANDPAAGDFARFELLNADLVSRVEVVRGPQSALWGSEAIGGVVAVEGVTDARQAGALAEAGSFGFRRAAASGAARSGSAEIAGGIGWQRSDGIDSFSGDGDRDGYRNLSARLRGTVRLGPLASLNAAAFALTGRSDFDGYDELTFERADTLDTSSNRLAAGRLWVELGESGSGWSGRAGASLLGSTNRNERGGEPVNRTRGTRSTFDAQAEHRFSAGPVASSLILAADGSRETFRARDTIYFGATDQDRSRSHLALTAEWRAVAGAFTGGLAARRDMFNRFRDATSLRASLRADLGGGFAAAGSYAQGIAQPTFFDLYGFFPGNFVGNPDLRPESSRGIEASLRFRRPAFAASLTAFRQRLHDEIVSTFDFATFLASAANSEAESRRWGVETELAWKPLDSLRLSASYAYLRATQPDTAGGRQLAELRRPRHSGSLAVDGAAGRWSYGASLAYVGARSDFQEVRPFGTVRLDPYWLAGARAAFAVRPGVELFARASNLFDSRYEDSAGYRTEGRGLFGGLSLSAGPRSSR